MEMGVLLVLISSTGLTVRSATLASTVMRKGCSTVHLVLSANTLMRLAASRLLRVLTARQVGILRRRLQLSVHCVPRPSRHQVRLARQSRQCARYVKRDATPPLTEQLLVCLVPLECTRKQRNQHARSVKVTSQQLKVTDAQLLTASRTAPSARRLQALPRRAHPVDRELIMTRRGRRSAHCALQGALCVSRGKVVVMNVLLGPMLRRKVALSAHSVLVANLVPSLPPSTPLAASSANWDTTHSLE